MDCSGCVEVYPLILHLLLVMNDSFVKSRALLSPEEGDCGCACVCGVGNAGCAWFCARAAILMDFMENGKANGIDGRGLVGEVGRACDGWRQEQVRGLIVTGRLNDES